MSDTVQHNPIVNPTGKVPVGISDFAELVQEDYCFVDKTLFIKEFLDVGGKVMTCTPFCGLVNLSTNGGYNGKNQKVHKTIQTRCCSSCFERR
ncbi:MAG: AAA family ATPase [Myxococcota bacterium]